MKKKILITLLSLFTFVTLSFADSGYVYKGKIGNYPVVVTLWATAAYASGEYYYVSQGPYNTLQLEGVNRGYYWDFTETLNGDFNGSFRLKWNLATRTGYKTVTGTYTNLKGKTFKVVLNCIRLL